VKRIFDKYVIPEIGGRLANSVSGPHITRLIDGIAAPTMAQGVDARLSVFYSWAMPRLDKLEANPCREDWKPPKPPPHDRVLSEDEIKTLWKAVADELVPFEPGRNSFSPEGYNVMQDSSCLVEVDANERAMHVGSTPGHNSDPGPRALNLDLAEVATLPLFEGIGGDFVDRLLSACSGLQYRSGSVIVREGASLEGLHVVHKGLVDLAHVAGEHECGVLLLSTRDLLLPSVSLFSERALVSARALTTTKLIVFDADAVGAVLAECDRLAANIMKAISGQWRMAVRNILDLNCRTAAQRLASFLLRLVDLQQESGAPVLPIAKRHLAVRLGMTAETLSRMLQVIANNGLHLRGRTIIVYDREKAQAFCGPDPYPSTDDRALNVFAL
jgi:CRP-like cAMP-binding protein